MRNDGLLSRGKRLDGFVEKHGEFHLGIEVLGVGISLSSVSPSVRPSVPGNCESSETDGRADQSADHGRPLEIPFEALGQLGRRRLTPAVCLTKIPLDPSEPSDLIGETRSGIRTKLPPSAIARVIPSRTHHTA